MVNIRILYKGYYHLVYKTTQAALDPVVDSITDVFQDAIKRAVLQGVRDALNPADILGDFLRKKK